MFAKKKLLSNIFLLNINLQQNHQLISTKLTFICNILKSRKHHQKNEKTYKLVSKLIENLLTCGVCDLQQNLYGFVTIPKHVRYIEKFVRKTNFLQTL
jgi:hypothetical protein